MKLPRKVLVVFALVLAVAPTLASDYSQPIALPEAHAHNDYHHPRPLFDALAHGFCSVEADIFLVDGTLLVAHERSELHPQRTLRALYLDPLRQLVEANGGRVQKNGPEFTLLIDIKSDGAETYRALSALLAGYGDVFHHVHDGRAVKKAVTAIISGNRPQELMTAEKTRYAGIDGRLTDLDSDRPAHLLPLISDNWGNHFKWRGKGAISPAEREKLHRIVKKAHAKGRRVRFWATPEAPAVWSELLAAGVDHLGTDDLCGLQRFLLKSVSHSSVRRGIRPAVER